MADKNLVQKIFGIFSKDKEIKDTVRQKQKIQLLDADDSPVQRGDVRLKSYMNFVYGDEFYSLSDKARILEYWRMSFDGEVNNIVWEIVDEIVTEEDQEYVTLDFPNYRKSLTEEKQNILIQRFKSFLGNLGLLEFDMIDDLVYRWVIQGILTLRIYYSKEKTPYNADRFVIERLEEIQSWDLSKGIDENGAEFYLYKTKDENGKEVVYKLLPEEVLIVDSGMFYEGKVASLLEYLKKDYRRIMLLEDSAVIFRLLRSPVRRVFYVYVGKMPPQKAERFIEMFRTKMKDKVEYSESDRGLSIRYNPISLLDDYYFPEYEGAKGVTIEPLDERGSLDWNILPEIMYFLKKMYRSAKIPSSRIAVYSEGEAPSLVVGSRVGEITREELRFSKFIRRLQARFAKQFFKQLFLRELLISGLLETLKIYANDFNIKFNKPSYYDEFKESDLWETRIGQYTQLIGDQNLAKKFVLKKFLKLNDQEIKENEELLKKEIGEGQMPEEEFGGGFTGGGFGGEMGHAPEIPEVTETPETGGEEIGRGEETAPPEAGGGENIE